MELWPGLGVPARAEGPLRTRNVWDEAAKTTDSRAPAFQCSSVGSLQIKWDLF